MNTEKTLTMSPFRLAPGAVTQAEISLVLGSLPENALVALVHEKAMKISMPWLHALLEGGLLDIEWQMDEIESQRQWQGLCEQLGHRARAVTAFMDGIVLGCSDDMQSDDLSKAPLMVLEFNPPSELQALFALGCQQMVRAYGLLAGHPLHGRKMNHSNDSVNAMGQWMAAACVLDMPESLALLIEACPAGLENTLAPESLGSVVKRNAFFNDVEVEPSPGFVALQLSRIACLDLIAAASPSKILGMGMSREDDGAWKVLDFLGHLQSPAFQPLCRIDAFAHALRLMLGAQDTPLTDALKKAGLAAMSQGDNITMLPYVAAFTRAGIYHLQPEEALRQACIQGHVEVVDSLAGNVNWESLAPAFKTADSMIYLALSGDKQDAGDRIGAVQAMMRMATDEGHAHTVAALFDMPCDGVQSDLVAQPLFEVLDLNATPILLHYLAQGLDPEASPGPGRLSPIALAVAIDSPASDVLRAWAARRTANDVLAMIEGENADVTDLGPAAHPFSVRP